MKKRATDTAAEKRMLKAVWIVIFLTVAFPLAVLVSVALIINWLLRIVTS